MTDKQETSRHWILDAIECIKNCEAIVSHCNEIMDSIYDNVSKNDKAYDDYMNLNSMKEIVKLIPSGKKILVEQVAFVNKIPYFVEVNSPERVYTLLEIWRPKKK